MTFEVRDKIACAQFIAELSEGFIKRTLQLEGVVFLKTAVERARMIRAISEENFSRFQQRERREEGRNVEKHRGEKRTEEKSFSKKYWQRMLAMQKHRAFPRGMPSFE